MDLQIDCSTLRSALEDRGPIVNSTDALHGNAWSHFAAAALNVFGDKQAASSHSHWIVCTQGMPLLLCLDQDSLIENLWYKLVSSFWFLI